MDHPGLVRQCLLVQARSLQGDRHLAAHSRQQMQVRGRQQLPGLGGNIDNPERPALEDQGNTGMEQQPPVVASG